MMKSTLAAVVGIAGLAAAASADWGLKFEVWNGAGWANTTNASLGSVLQVRVGSYFTDGTMVTTADGTGQALDLNRFTGSNKFMNFSAGQDVIQNLVRTMPSGNPALLTNTGNGIVGSTLATSFASQLILTPLDPTPVYYREIYTGEIKIGDGSVRTLTWTSNSFGVSPSTKGLTFYNAGSLTNKITGQPDGNPTFLAATIQVVPAPSAAALLGLGGLAIARRRRA